MIKYLREDLVELDGEDGFFVVSGSQPNLLYLRKLPELTEVIARPDMVESHYRPVE